MIEFLLGVVVGSVLSIAVLVVASYFEARGKSFVRYVTSSPLVKADGFIVESTEEQEARDSIIRRNNEKGLPTKLEEL